MKARREIQSNMLKSIVNARPVKDDRGNHKKDSTGRRVFQGSNHAELTGAGSRAQVHYHPHYNSFEFVIT